MKFKIILTLVIGVTVGALGMYLIGYGRTTDSSEYSGSIQYSLNDVDETFSGILSFNEATESKAIEWVKNFDTYNKSLADKRIEPAFWGKGIQARHYGDDVKCGLDYLFISKPDFEEMLKIKGCQGFKIYPAIRKFKVLNDKTPDPNDTFDHSGFTLIFSPTDASGKCLTDADNVIRTFEYVDPCPTECHSDSNDLLKKASIPYESCN